MSRKRVDSLKNSIPLPTSSRPQSEDLNSLLNYRESGIVLLSLTQSRQAWTTSIFKRFSHRHEIEYKPSLPENTNSNPIISSLGKCHITIGPHTFYDTRILEVVYEKELPAQQPEASTSTYQPSQSQNQQNRQQSQEPTTQVSPSQTQLPPPPQVVIQPQPQVIIEQPDPLPTTTSRTSSHQRVRPVAPTPSSSASSSSQVRPVAPAPTSNLTRAVAPAPSPTSSGSAASPSTPATQTAVATASQTTNSTSSTCSNNGNGNGDGNENNASSSFTPATAPQLTAFMQTVLQSVNPTQILALQALLRQQQSGIPLSLEQRNALLQQLTALHQLLSTSQQLQPPYNPTTQPTPIAPASATQPRTAAQTMRTPQTLRPTSQTIRVNNHTQVQTPLRPTRQFVRHDIVIEFRENKYDRWLFPKEAILETTTPGPPFEILASFYLPQNEDKTNSRQKYQAVTMQLSHVSPNIWEALRRATNDITLVYQAMIPKTTCNPSRVYMQYRLPCDYPEELLEMIGQRVSKLDGTLQIENIQPTVPRERKRKADKEKEEAKEKDEEKVRDKGKEKGKGKAKEKEVDIEDRISEDEHQRTSKRVRGSSGTIASPKASSSTAPKKQKSVPEFTSSNEPPPSYGQSGANKRCAYCGCKSTPMWRRGPDGAGTLCNACGVKWKQGKILGGANASTSKSRVARGGGNTNEATSPGTNQRGKRKLSVSVGGTALLGSSKNKSARSLSASEGALSVTDEDDVEDRSQVASANKPLTVSQKSIFRGRRASKKGSNLKGESIAQSSTASGTILGGELAESPDPTSPGMFSPLRSPQYTTTHGQSSLPRAITADHSSSSSGYPITLKLISIAFGPNNAHFVQPNCSVALHEDFIKIRLAKDGYEKTSIDIWKESIEDIDFVTEHEPATGVPLLTIKALVAQYLTRFDQELLNPDRNETLVILKCLNAAPKNDESVEQKDLKPILQQWLQQI